jgi:hypothetical protein
MACLGEGRSEKSRLIWNSLFVNRTILIILAGLVALIVLFKLREAPVTRGSRAPPVQNSGENGAVGMVGSATSAPMPEDRMVVEAEAARNHESSEASADGQIPKHIQPLLERKWLGPSLKVLEELGPEDEMALVQLYESEPELTNKVVFAWALAAVGSDAAARALQHALTHDYDERVLNISDFNPLVVSIWALGFIGSRSEPAFSWLWEAVSEEFWQLHRMWRFSDPAMEAYANQRFAGLAISSLGKTGQASVFEKLMELKEMQSRLPKGLLGPTADAAFNFHIAANEGPDTLLRYKFTSEYTTELRRWRTETEDGREWWTWFLSGMRSLD